MKLTQSIVVFLLVLCLASCFGFNSRELKRGAIHAVYPITDFNGTCIDFYADSTYTVCQWSIGADFYDGTFSVKDSVFTLRGKADEPFSNCRLKPFIETHTYQQDTAEVTEKQIMLYQIDKNGIKDPAGMYFKVLL